MHTGHATQPEATACARAALTAIRACTGTPPAGWIRYQPATPA